MEPTTQQINEEWKVIEGFEDYLISNTGRIRSSRSGRDKELNPYIVNGYKQVKLCSYDDNYIAHTYNRFIHRLTAAAFCEKATEQQTIVHHIDHNKLNNNYTNLQWVTPKQHAAIHKKDLEDQIKQ